MHGTVLEIGTRGGKSYGAASRWGWDLSLYRAAVRDEILSVDDLAAPGTSLTTNVDRTTHSGLEALIEASWRMRNRGSLQPQLSLTINHFEFDSDPVYGGNQLPAAPDYALRGELIYRSDRGWFAGPTFEIVGERFADFENSYVVDDYALLGLRAGWRGPGWHIFADLGNVLDADYVTTHYVRDVAGDDAAILFPGAPRSVFIGAEYQF
jgi:iron complex outermembrane receptor protein